MNSGFSPPKHPLLVYTDLDGTLLDHDSYSFEPAMPALQRLQLLGIPVVPVTSKTLAELDALTQQLDLRGPCIAENGGLIAYPPGYFPDLGDCATIGRYRVRQLSPDYRTIVADLDRLRAASGFRFEGFADVTPERVSELTGLTEQEAVLAKQRLCSEPLVWQDSEPAFARFSSQLQQRQYRLVHGGVFWHVMGQTDKALAIDRLNEDFSRAGFSGFTSIALGDSPNDIPMLMHADIAVVIRRKDGFELTLEGARAVFRTHGTGPEGWNEFFQDYLDKKASGGDARDLEVRGGKIRTRHG